MSDVARIYLLFEGKTAGDRAIDAIGEWHAALVLLSHEVKNPGTETYKGREKDADLKEQTAISSRDKVFQEMSKQIRAEGRLRLFRLLRSS